MMVTLTEEELLKLANDSLRTGKALRELLKEAILRESILSEPPTEDSGIVGRSGYKKQVKAQLG